MQPRAAVALSLIAVALAVTGCLHGPSPGEVRDGFVDSVEEVDSYSYEGETQFEIDGGPGTSTLTTEVSTHATVDREARELHANITSRQWETSAQGGRVNETVVETTSYLVNGSVYDWTVTDGNVSEARWLRYDRASDVEEEWSSRDELGLYAELLRNASLSEADASDEAGDSRVFRVELDREGRLRLLEGKFGDQAAFFSDFEVDEFEMKVRFTGGDRIDQVEAEMSMTKEQPDQAAETLYVDASFEDDFSGYDDSVDIELPEGARDAQPVGRIPR